MEYKMQDENNNTRVGTIAHINTNYRRPGRSQSMALLAAAAMLSSPAIGGSAPNQWAQNLDKNFKDLFNTKLRVKRTAPLMREKIRTFTELPKVKIADIDVSTAVTGLKSAQIFTVYSIFEIYQNEDTIDEINAMDSWSNQHTAQFIHGAYMIILMDLENMVQHIRANPKQKNNCNTLQNIVDAVKILAGQKMVDLLSAAEPTGNQRISAEGITALKQFEGIHRRIKNISVKIADFQRR